MQLTTTFETTKNREIAEQVFDYMISVGFKPYDIEWGNGYFIFDMGDDSVIHFRVKGVSKHWKFGMWVDSETLSMDEEQMEKERTLDGMRYGDRRKVVRFFAQWDTCIDKFKPTRSDLLVDIDAVRWVDDMVNEFDPETTLWEIQKMLRTMRMHPLLCYAGVIGGDGGRSYWDESFLWHFIKNEGETYFTKFRMHLMWLIWVPYTYLKCWIAGKARIIDHIHIEDFEKENTGWKTNYKYGVWVTFREDATDTDMVLWLNRWFHKDKYGKFDMYDYQVELQHLKQVGRDSLFTFPKRGEKE